MKAVPVGFVALAGLVGATFGVLAQYANDKAREGEPVVWIAEDVDSPFNVPAGHQLNIVMSINDTGDDDFNNIQRLAAAQRCNDMGGIVMFEEPAFYCMDVDY